MYLANDGLLQARLLDGQGGDRHLAWEAIGDWRPEDGVLWVHLDFTHERARAWLKEESGLDPLVADALLADETRPRCAAIAGGLLASLRGVNTNPGADPEDMVAIRLFTDGRRVISTRRRKLMSVMDIAEALDAGRGPCSAGEWLAALAGRLVERMGGVVEEMEDRLDAAEETLLVNSSQGLRMSLLALRRETIMLRRYLSPQREAMSRMMAEQADWLSQADRLRLREAGDKVTRYVEELDAVRDRGIVASEELTGRLSEQLNLRMYVLSLIAGIFLPLGFVTGLLGINVGGIPGADNPWGFWEVVLMLVVIAALQLLLFRRQRWL
jgi:zinc transporter